MQETPADSAAMDHQHWHITIGDTPLVVTALHAGHEVRPEIAPWFGISENDRLREEDPGTGEWTDLGGTRVVVRHSRFELDLNRTRTKAVYRAPEDAWGLTVWREPLDTQLIARSLATYDAFYAQMRVLLEEAIRRHGRFVLLDLHAYNHRRGGPSAPAAEQTGNPDIDVEIDAQSRSRWTLLVDRFTRELRAGDCAGERFDVRENIRFEPGHFVCWVNETFGEFGCALAVEFKKRYMDEWTGEIDCAHHAAIGRALRSTVAGLLEELAARK